MQVAEVGGTDSVFEEEKKLIVDNRVTANRVLRNNRSKRIKPNTASENKELNSSGLIKPEKTSSKCPTSQRDNEILDDPKFTIHIDHISPQQMKGTEKKKKKKKKKTSVSGKHQ